VGPGRFFSLLIYLQLVGLIGRVISSSEGLYLNTVQHKHRIDVCTHQILGFEPTIPASERAKTVHALDRLATVTCKRHICWHKYTQTGCKRAQQYIRIMPVKWV
jgi:hypothetical protein